MLKLFTVRLGFRALPPIGDEAANGWGTAHFWLREKCGFDGKLWARFLVSGEDGLVVADVLGDNEGGAEAGLGSFAAGFAHGLEAIGVFEQA